jgi:hypothetical protein
MPRRPAAPRMVGWMLPSNCRCAGEASATDDTLATWAGTTFITTLEKYAALPPGTYKPTRATGLQRWTTSAPGPRVVTLGVGNWASEAARTRTIASSSASRTGTLRARTAAEISATSSRTRDGRTPSSRSAWSRSATSPRSRTSEMRSRATAVAAETSVSERGTRARSSARLGLRPRRSIVWIMARRV